MLLLLESGLVERKIIAYLHRIKTESELFTENININTLLRV